MAELRKMPGPRARFSDFVHRKERAAIVARLETYVTVRDDAASAGLEPIGNAFTDALLDGPFFQSPVPATSFPAVSLVFVQSRDRNTEADDPSSLGGGETDKHVIYEGLSRAAADAVLAGASTIREGDVLFSVWHPELVALRAAMRKPRHPMQVVATRSGNLPIDQGLLFNVPEIPVAVATTTSAAGALRERTQSRPWITVIDCGIDGDLSRAAQRLRSDHAVSRLSVVGGRTVATELLDAGVVGDLYLTTAPVDGGTPNTPMYTGHRNLHRELAIRKRSSAGALFEHFIVRTAR